MILTLSKINDIPAGSTSVIIQSLFDLIVQKYLLIKYNVVRTVYRPMGILL
jgi:hypothetical protein